MKRFPLRTNFEPTFLDILVCMHACMHACAYERERDRERESMRARACVCVLAHTFQLFKQLTAFQETWNEHYATSGCSKATHS